MEQFKTTSNSLKDVIDWIKDGNCVILYSKGKPSLIYHDCNKELKRVIFIEIIMMPSLLDEGEWPWYIENSGCKQCSCIIKDKILNKEHLDNIFHYKL